MNSTNYPTSVTVSALGRVQYFEPGLQKENDAYNLQLLFNRMESGTLFRASEDGRLQVVEGFWSRLSYFWNRKAEQAAVKRVISDALENYNSYLSRSNNERIDRFCVSVLFQRIGHLSPRVLDPSHFHSLSKLSEYTLSPHTTRLKVGDAYIDFANAELEEGDPCFLEFDLGSEVDNANFAKLLKREKGERFQVDAQGRLERASGLSCSSEREHQNRRVQEVVTHVLGQLNTALARTRLTRTHKVVLKKIFTEGPLIRMKREVYNRGAVKEGSCLEQVLGEAFGSELAKKREALKSILKTYRLLAERNEPEARAAIESKFMDLVLEEYYFAYQLGFDLERVGDGGSGGARYGRDRHGRKILVVKPGDEGPHGPNNPQWYAKFKKWIVSPRECMKGNSEPLSEVDSYLLDRHLGIYQVPPTEWRYIASRQFNGEVFKECSVQMFVQGCQTMGEYVNISSKLFNLPRPLLRWYCGEENGWLTRRAARNELLAKVPQESVQRLAAHNLTIEDIDCHFENVLVLLRDAGGNPSLIERIFAGKNVEDREIDDFVDTFFEDGHNQDLLQAILFSEEVMVNGERKRVSFVKHDGGSSNPRLHPEGYLSTRFKHLFEVLPNFEQPFSEEYKEYLSNKDRQFVEFLLEKSVRALRNTLTPKVFLRYWNDENNRLNFKLWVLETDPTRELELREKVRNNLMAANIVDQQNQQRYRSYFNSHLERIRGNISTRFESWRLLNQFLRSNRPMREALLTCTQEDFEQELTNDSGEDLERHLVAAKERGVRSGASYLRDRYFVGSHVLADLGERDAIG